MSWQGKREVDLYRGKCLGFWAQQVTQKYKWSWLDMTDDAKDIIRMFTNPNSRWRIFLVGSFIDLSYILGRELIGQFFYMIEQLLMFQNELHLQCYKDIEKVTGRTFPKKVTSNSSWIFRHSSTASQVFEERQKRLLSEVEAERSDGDSRAQRLRQELRRLEQDRVRWRFFSPESCFSFNENSSTTYKNQKQNHVHVIQYSQYSGPKTNIVPFGIGWRWQDADEVSSSARIENRRRDQQMAELERLWRW